jgi:hypothetical protein
MKHAIPLLIEKSREIAGSPAIGREPRFTAACNLQMSTTLFLHIATSSSFGSSEA